MEIREISKEELRFVVFSGKIKRNISSKNQIMHDLMLAQTLGNIMKTKCKIVLKTLSGIVKVYTTIWFVSENYICLKGGITIPTNCIENIELI